MKMNLIKDMYEETSTRVIHLCGETEDFSVKVEVH